MKPVKDPWSPLPEAQWSTETARHLASRIGYSIHPSLVKRIESRGVEGTLKAAYGKIRPFHKPEDIINMEGMRDEYQMMQRQADSVEKRELRQKLQRERNRTYGEFSVDWCKFARDPQNSPQEKLVQFFQDVWVVAYQGVRSPGSLYDFQQQIRIHLGKPYPEMCRRLSVTPAMVRYLNQNQNRKGSPNENFARELFELFCLGEGNYTEADIKEAARALTGYTINGREEVNFVRQRHDAGKKTIFGQTGNYALDDVIDIVFEQPAAARFLPQEMVRFYLTEEGLPDEVIQPLADKWKASGYSIPHLVKTFFSSKIFYDPAFRGNMIKSPTQYYLGLLQDLELDVFPSPRRSTNQLRSMGQQFFNPPNVRGWVGGRHWINSATLSARKQVVSSLMYPFPKNRLNADEEKAVEAAVAAGVDKFNVTPQQLRDLFGNEPGRVADALAERFFVTQNGDNLQDLLREIPRDRKGQARFFAVLSTALSAPDYHLC